MKKLEDQVLAKLKKPKPIKKRVTFFISLNAKDALARWCKDNDVMESPAVEAMIRATIPENYFKKGASQ